MSPELREEIKSFLFRRWQADANWLNGNCLYFASILVMRFEQLKIYYLPFAGHFVAGADGVYFDWIGEVEIDKDEPVIDFQWIKDNDPLWYSHLIRDCFN